MERQAALFVVIALAGCAAQPNSLVVRVAQWQPERLPMGLVVVRNEAARVDRVSGAAVVEPRDPVSAAKVECNPVDRCGHGITDEQGNLTLQLTGTGPLTIRVSHEKFEPVEVTAEGRDVRLFVLLAPRGDTEAER